MLKQAGNQKVEGGLADFGSVTFVFFCDGYILDLAVLDRYICSNHAGPAVAGTFYGIDSVSQCSFFRGILFPHSLIQGAFGSGLYSSACYGGSRNTVDF